MSEGEITNSQNLSSFRAVIVHCVRYIPNHTSRFSTHKKAMKGLTSYLHFVRSLFPNTLCTVDTLFIYFSITQLTALRTSSYLSENVGHQLIKVTLTKLSIFMHRHHFSLTSYKKQFLHAKCVPSKIIFYLTFTMLLA